MIRPLKITLSVILAIGIIFLFMAFITDNEGKVLARLAQKGIVPETHLINYRDSLHIRVMAFGNRHNPPLVLIHGSPGDWSAWENIIANDSVRQACYILAIDRPGYGQTTVPPQGQLAIQAGIVWQALQSLSITREITIVGHSYGGAVVIRLLLDYPHAFRLAVLAAPTLSPEIMAPRWYNKVARWRPVKAVLPDYLQSSNIEMLGLPAGLREHEGKLPAIPTPIIYLQGQKDVLVAAETVDYFRQYKPHGVKYIIIADMNHFIPWSAPCLISDAVLGKVK